ncbi:MAG: PIG-L deacetylase family protein [Bdellovibrionota bacterium]
MSMKNVLIVAVHPDDETLGAGGTILKYKEQGHSVHWLIVTKAEPKMGFSQQSIDLREQEISAVSQKYAFDSIHKLNFGATRLDQYTNKEIIDQLVPILETIQPHDIFLPFWGDVHTDHKRTFECFFPILKSFRLPFIESIFCMETLSETDFALQSSHQSFQPNYFVNIEPYIEKKLDIMKIYKSEIAPPPFPRSLENIEALSKYRGGSSGYKYAEAFMMIKTRIF